MSCRVQVQYCAQFANGAGISLIMAYLNGNSIPDLLSFRSAPDQSLAVPQHQLSACAMACGPLHAVRREQWCGAAGRCL